MKTLVLSLAVAAFATGASAYSCNYGSEQVSTPPAEQSTPAT
ncbi:MAG: hypothetical protein AAGI70_05685 [Pseudomonadota bacterium]